MLNSDNQLSTFQNAGTNNNNNIELLKKLGIEFCYDNNGNIQSRCSKIINPEKLFTDPELIKHFKGGWFVSDPTETHWFYIRIINGKIKEVIPVTSAHINSFLIMNYNKGVFDSIFLEYSTNVEHTESKVAAILYKNCSPKRITNDFTGTPYTSEEGEKLKGSLLYYLVSQHLKNPRSQNIIHIGSKQGWWITPLNKYRFCPSYNFKQEILEKLPPAVKYRENPIQGTNPPQDVTKELQPMFNEKFPFMTAILYRMGSSARKMKRKCLR